VRCATTCLRQARYTERRARILTRVRRVGTCVRGQVFRGFGGPSPCGPKRLNF